MNEYVYAYRYQNGIKFGFSKDSDFRHRDVFDGKRKSVEIIHSVYVEPGLGYEFYSRLIGTAFEKHLGKAVFDLTKEEVIKTFLLVSEQIENFCKKTLDKNWSRHILYNNVGENYILNQEKFFEYCREKGITNRVKKPKHLPNNFAPDSDVYKSRIALEAKFNRKFTDDEVIELLQELPKKKKSSDDVEIPQWYIDKWLTK